MVQTVTEHLLVHGLSNPIGGDHPLDAGVGGGGWRGWAGRLGQLVDALTAARRRRH